jgi:pyruvate dehydrogenase phosphatase
MFASSTNPSIHSSSIPRSPVYSKWAIDSSSDGFVDDALRIQQLSLSNSNNNIINYEDNHNNTFNFSVSSVQIDAYTPIEDKLYVNEKDKLFAVFDGHGGDICSRYISDKLPKQLLSSLRNRNPQSESDYASVLKSTFMKADEQFLNEHKLLVKTCPAGSCGVTVLVRNDTLYISNLGDSRVLLGSKSPKATHKLLTNDHNTKNEKERQLVMQRTSDPMPIRGHVSTKVEGERVGGILMVTRAFGDGIFKRKDMSVQPLIQHLPYITSEPEITTHKITSSDKYVVIASDGLYELLTPAVVADIVEKQLETTRDGKVIGAALLDTIFETIAKLVGKTVAQVKNLPNRKSFMDDTSIIVLLFDEAPACGGAAAK